MRRNIIFGLVLLAIACAHAQLVPSLTWCQAEYVRMNRLYFNDRLLPNTRFVYMTNPRFIAGTGRVTTDGIQYVIHLNPIFNIGEKYTVINIAHEMCHIETWDTDRGEDGHGDAWQGCMHRLADAGAFNAYW